MKRTTPGGLSDKQLLAQIEKIRGCEHRSTLEILTHLNEIERRKLHLKLGYGSLFDYCVQHLRYSTSGAGRRVAVARCIAKHPEVYDMLRSRVLTVTGVALVASVLKDDNKAEILGRIQNKSQREIDAIAARYRPPVALRDRVKPVAVRIPEPSGPVQRSESKAPEHAGTVPATPARRACEKSNYSHNGSGHELSESMTRQNATARPNPVRVEQRLLIQFLANKEFMKKYEEVRALLSQRLSNTSFDNVFGILIQEFLERNSSLYKKARREKKSDARKTRAPEERQTIEKPPAVAASNRARPQRRAARTARGGTQRTRHIPVAVRDEVFVRDKSRCTYVGNTGRRCRSTHALQIDHIEPFTRGGASTASNLRLLCAKHNRLAAEEMLGPGYANRFRRRE